MMTKKEEKKTEQRKGIAYEMKWKRKTWKK